MSLSVKLMAYNKQHKHLVSWNLTSLFSTNTAISETTQVFLVINNEFVLIRNFTTEAISYRMFILLMFQRGVHTCVRYNSLSGVDFTILDYTSLPCTNGQYKITRRRRNIRSTC